MWKQLSRQPLPWALALQPHMTDFRSTDASTASLTMDHSYAVAEMVDMLGEEHFSEILDSLARNVKMGPFVATSGLVVPYLVNLVRSLLESFAQNARFWEI